MTLLIDIGNTRVKWATLNDAQVGEQHAAAYVDWSDADLRARLLDTVAKPTRVLISNVAGIQVAERFTAAMLSAWSLKPQFARTTAHAAGVRCGYADPTLLGVDRWMGVIGAFHLVHGAACVVSVGTAMTVDGVDASGAHFGGAIVPGPDLMTSALYRNTSDIAERARAGGNNTELFANNTQSAVHQGITHALAALAERAYHDMIVRIGGAPALILTGGASSRVAAALRVPYQAVPDLVLRGLAKLASESSAWS